MLSGDLGQPHTVDEKNAVTVMPNATINSAAIQAPLAAKQHASLLRFRSLANLVIRLGSTTSRKASSIIVLLTDGTWDMSTTNRTTRTSTQAETVYGNVD
jgi:hypothetical protein